MKKANLLDSLLPIPIELRDIIRSYIDVDKQLMKTLRLTSKKLKDIITPHLFKTIYVHMDPASWDMVNKIANEDGLRNHVQQISCQTGMLPPLWNEGHWDREVRNSYGRLSMEQLDFYWKKFEDWRSAEQKLFRSLADPDREFQELQLQLSKLEKLHSIKTVYQTPSGLSKLEQDTLISPERWLRDNTHLMLLLQSMERNKVHLSSLKFTHFPASIRHYPSRLHITDFDGAIRHLQHLDLDFAGWLSYDQLGIETNDRPRFTDWLMKATQLETFKLRQDSTDYNSKLSLIRNLNECVHTWPKLNTVHFVTACDTIRDITDFLIRHKSSLHRVHIDRTGRRGRGGSCWLQGIKDIADTAFLSLNDFTFQGHVFDQMLPAGMAKRVYDVFDPYTYDETESAMNNELQYIGRHGHSSSSYKRKHVLGDYFPVYSSHGTEEAFIKIGGEVC